MKKPVLLSTLGAWLLACAVPLANANTADTVGKKIYETTCAACHANGVASAPKPGDAKAWAPLIEEGQDILTAHAWVGVRAMPAQGGAPDLTLDDFAQAVAWMASASGGNWKAPDAAMMHRIRQAEEADKKPSSYYMRVLKEAKRRSIEEFAVALGVTEEAAEARLAQAALN